ncbi:hypothetical protein A5881_003879 [Enterococcus termitis]|nr:hypothetical protein A5881_003735 [Enterococcus termitis]
MLEEHEYENVFSDQLINVVKDQFNTEYINQQMNIMISLIDSSPTDVIGKAKELVESCFKHILDDYGECYNNGDSLSQLRKKVFKKLNLDVKTNISAKNNDDVKKILSSFNTIIDGLSSLRNEKGDGHGKGKHYKELPKRYAELAMNSSLSLVHFIWETHRDLQN